MNKTELLILNFYHSFDVLDTSIFTIDTITERLSIYKLYHRPHSSAIASYGNKYCVFINELLTSQQQWQDFCHEMYHYFYDETSYADYGEIKSRLLFCVSTFMLDQLKKVNVYGVMDLSLDLVVNVENHGQYD